MRVQCDNCTINLAAVMCCADEAALCTSCDIRVHAANKLANKHQRVPLFPTTTDPPACDICQEKRAFFFCLEDRALLCRDCDVSIHMPSSLSATHQRYLLTGTRVALEALPNNMNTDTSDDLQAVPAHSLPATSGITSGMTSGMTSGSGGRRGAHSLTRFESLQSENNVVGRIEGRMDGRTEGNGAMQHQYTGYAQASPSVGGGRGPASHGHEMVQARPNGGGSEMGWKSSYSDILSDAVPEWGVDELLNIPELADGYSLSDIGSSKAEAEVAALGDFDWTADLSLFDEQVYAESLHEVPQFPHMGGGAGFGMGKTQNPLKGRARYDMAAVVPDYDDSFVVPDLGLDMMLPVTKKQRNGYM